MYIYIYIYQDKKEHIKSIEFEEMKKLNVRVLSPKSTIPGALSTLDSGFMNKQNQQVCI